MANPNHWQSSPWLHRVVADAVKASMHRLRKLPEIGADDVVQMALIDWLPSTMPKYRIGEAALPTWVTRVVRLRIIDLYRKHHRRAESTVSLSCYSTTN